MTSSEDSLRRLAYLKEMGIQVWQLRRGDVSREKGAAIDAMPPPVAAVGSSPSGTTHSSSLQDWQSLEARVAACDQCDLSQQRSQSVFGVGHRQARWMVIGEAPGADEDRQGEPFVGRAGQLLNLMLQAIGLKRQEVYIANIVKCRPPNNRDPKAEEVAACRPYLKAQIELIQPEVILAVGRVAAHNLLQTNQKVGVLRGQCHRYEETDIPVIVTYHPAYLLRSPQEKRKAWADLLFARQQLGDH